MTDPRNDAPDPDKLAKIQHSGEGDEQLREEVAHLRELLKDPKRLKEAAAALLREEGEDDHLTTDEILERLRDEDTDTDART